jgi:hypothetical protein
MIAAELMSRRDKKCKEIDSLNRIDVDLGKKNEAKTFSERLLNH